VKSWEIIVRAFSNTNRRCLCKSLQPSASCLSFMSSL